MINFNTDLADERRDIYRKANNIEEEIEGRETEEKNITDKIKLFKVKITDENGSKALGKPIGNYITVDIKKLKIADMNEIDSAAKVVTEELSSLINSHVDKQGDI